ncbi:hypothetical protein [Streptomyces sp. NBC_01244]|uniref:hypothetical protein n=1 Tax=Streptomyces sp. NBC_01244 TaxID=2903797 RepID=UPI002E12B653|nr:hypothetical protein OG247_44020 [Streptomyces sp. NBC_01244]
MPTTVMGFRLGSDKQGRQVTVVLTQAGVLHRCNGPMGLAPKPTKPAVPCSVDPHPVPRQAARLRQIHAELTGRGYDRVLVAPACVRLGVTEHPLHAHPHGPNAPAVHLELLEEFIGLAPSAPRHLDEAFRDFYTAIGLPARPKHLVRADPTQAPPASRVDGALRVLARGSAITSPARRAIGWRVTADDVRLQVGAGGEALAHREVAELQAALTAWLRLNPAPGTPAVPAPSSGTEPGTRVPSQTRADRARVGGRRQGGTSG